MTSKIGSSSGAASRGRAAGNNNERPGSGAGDAASSRFLSSIDASREADAVTRRPARRDQQPLAGEARSRPAVYNSRERISYREAVNSMAGKPARLHAMIERGNNQHKMLDIVVVSTDLHTGRAEPAALPLLAGGTIFLTSEQHDAWRSGLQDSEFEKELADLMLQSLQDSINW